MLKIHETTRSDGSFEPLFLRREDDVLFVVRKNEALPLPEGALAAVMARYGGPLADDVSLVEVDVLDLGDARLRHVRHLARYDVIARDFLVLEVPGEDPRCALATTVAGALEHLARARNV